MYRLQPLLLVAALAAQLLFLSAANESIDSIEKYRESLKSYLADHMQASNQEVLAKLQHWAADVSKTSQIDRNIVDTHGALISLGQQPSEERCGGKGSQLVDRLQPLVDSNNLGYYKQGLDLLLANIISEYARECLPYNLAELKQIEARLTELNPETLLDIEAMFVKLGPLNSVIPYYGSLSFNWSPCGFISGMGILNAARRHTDDPDVETILNRPNKVVSTARARSVFDRYGVEPCRVYVDSMDLLVKSMRLNRMSTDQVFDHELERAVFNYTNCRNIIGNSSWIFDRFKSVVKYETGKKVKDPNIISKAIKSLKSE